MPQPSLIEMTTKEFRAFVKTLSPEEAEAARHERRRHQRRRRAGRRGGVVKPHRTRAPRSANAK